MDPTALSYWFPKLATAGVRVPRTIILKMPKVAQEGLWGFMDGKPGTPEQLAAIKDFEGAIGNAADRLGWPAFLRTDHTSAKHFWKDACFLPNREAIPQHVWQIIEFSELCDLIGLSWSTWAVREFLQTAPVGVCPHYGDMPVTLEYRFFVDNGAIRCWHSYWPEQALKDGGFELNDELRHWLYSDPPADAAREAEKAGAAVPGSWSVDVLQTQLGWYVTDMAEAHKSWHWPGCPHARSERQFTEVSDG